MIRPRVGKLGCAGNPSCGCSQRMGDAGDFASSLTPDQTAELAAYQAANPGDPNLAPVLYNPVTQVYGPVTIPAQMGFTSPTNTPAQNQTFVLLAGVALAALFFFSSGSSTTVTKKKRR